MSFIHREIPSPSVGGAIQEMTAHEIQDVGGGLFVEIAVVVAVCALAYWAGRSQGDC